jgi:hypothetical protein
MALSQPHDRFIARRRFGSRPSRFAKPLKSENGPIPIAARCFTAIRYDRCFCLRVLNSPKQSAFQQILLWSLGQFFDFAIFICVPSIKKAVEIGKAQENTRTIVESINHHMNAAANVLVGISDPG